MDWTQKITNKLKGRLRGQNRTSIDAYLIAEIDGKITQLLVEWKFTETYNSESYTYKFEGTKGIERLRRYLSVLSKLKNSSFPPTSTFSI